MVTYETMSNSSAAKNKYPPKSRLILGGIIFICGFLSPLFIPLVTNSNLSTEWKTLLSGILILGMPEAFMLIAVAILGKQGFDYLKSRLWKFIRPAGKISATRYRIGLAMFFSPILFGWLSPYLELWYTGYEVYMTKMAIAGDLLFAASLFVLGGDFWLKIKALFVQNNAGL